ncbi:MAG TPA: aminotransferase class V-fold PLP-dependent enzyme [Candidatus Thermoplasmatota archaeon]|nr:aminotransferase class V-fold PLP-dependent enzyme [Candidatus Thermoplasmatota archaeon]
MTDWTSEFPGLSHGTYLNSCAHGLLARRVRAALDAHLDVWQDAPDWDVFAHTIERARRSFARLIGARPEEIALQANASTGFSSVMSAFRHGRIATLDIDFPTAGSVAQRQAARGMQHEQLRLGPMPKAAHWAPHVKGAALASIPAVASFTGYRLDVAEFAREAHARDVPLMVDAFQAAGTYPIDVKRSDVDFLVTGVYKWLLAPVGLAFLYVRPDHHALVPTVGGWYGLQEPYSFDPLGEIARDARRFEYGGPSIIGCAAAAASLDLIHEVGLASIERTNGALVERIMEKARERKFEILTPADPRERASIVTFRVPDLERALAACARGNVVVNPRLGGIRVSPHFYNRAADVDRLFDVLDAA